MSEDVIRYGKLAIDRFMVWKMAAVRCLFKATIATGGAYVALCQSGFSTEKWNSLGGAERGAIVVGLTCVFLSNIDAFLDKTITTISKRLGMEGNTEILTKE
jgi:hypothetical protein